jgi:chromosomal replication initiation ATPase DnaA
MLTSVFWLGVGTYILGLLSGYFNRVFNLFLVSVKINNKNAAPIYKYIKENAKFKFNFTESFTINETKTDIPENETSISLVNGVLLWTDISEKFLTAGSFSKENQVYLTFFRWQKKKLYNILKILEIPKPNRENVNVYLSRYYYFRHISSLKKDKYSSGIFLKSEIQSQIKSLIDDFNTKKRDRAGILLYGPPGNGKTSIIRQIACQQDMDIYIPVFRHDMSNDDIISLFAEVPNDKEAMIVLEDFDSVFDNRYPRFQDCKFSFDVFLNILDGLYSNLDNKIIVITANDINHIDTALKNRPSRLDIVLNIDNPDDEARYSILSKFKLENIDKLVELTEGQSAAIVAEIGKRGSYSEEVVQETINSFIKESNNNLFAQLAPPKPKNSPSRAAYRKRKWVSLVYDKNN